MSLWLNPEDRPVRVNLRDRFGGYPFFIESFAQYIDLRVPETVTVTWHPLKPLLTPLEGDEEEMEQHDQFIDYVTDIMRAGEDIPPVLIDKGRVFDGRHRSWAADQLGLEVAPVVDVSQYWG